MRVWFFAACLLAACFAVACTPVVDRSESPLESTPAACADGVDNDGDGAFDCADPGCAMACGAGDAGPGSVCRMGPENTPEACLDVCDNDGDGFVDCLDFECDAFCP